MNRVRIKIDPSDLVLEVISIVVAILLALSVNFLAGQVKTHNDVQGALNAISAEMSALTRTPAASRAPISRRMKLWLGRG